MRHEQAASLLSAQADDELNIWQRWRLAQHTRHCVSCSATLEELQAMRSAIRASLTTHRAPPGLAARIGAVLPREAPPPLPRRNPVPLRFGGAALAGCAAGVALTLLVARQPGAPDALPADAVASHIRSMMADHLTDVPTSDRHTVKPWLAGRLNFSPVVKDLAAEGFPLIGGRLDYVDGHDAAAVVYRRDQHVINLFVFAGTDKAPARETRNGFNVETWRQGGLTYVAVSDVEAAQLASFVRLVQDSG